MKVERWRKGKEGWGERNQSGKVENKGEGKMTTESKNGSWKREREKNKTGMVKKKREGGDEEVGRETGRKERKNGEERRKGRNGGK